MKQDTTQEIQDTIDYKVSLLEKELGELTGKTVKLTVHMVHRNFTPPEEFVSKVKSVVSELANTSIEEMESATRERNVVDGRRISFYLIKYFSPVYSFGLTLKKIGGFFGDRDHTTVLHNLEQYEALFMTDMRFRALANKCEERLKSVIEMEVTNEPAEAF